MPELPFHYDDDDDVRSFFVCLQPTYANVVSGGAGSWRQQAFYPPQFTPTPSSVNYYVLKTPEAIPVMMIAKLDSNAILPTKATTAAAGFDLYSPYDVDIPAWTIKTIPTGIRVTPPSGHYLMITGRSGLSQRGLLVLNGTVDPDYSGDVGIMIFNTTNFTVSFSRSQRIAQMIPVKFASNCTSVVMNQSELIHSDTLSLAAGGRGARGFGSSGL